MKNIAIFWSCSLLLAACNEPAKAPDSAQASGLRLLQEDNPAWACDQLRLYPILAEGSPEEWNASAGTLKTLAEGMQTPGFRITERKSFGRFQGATVNELTVQNRSQHTIYLMSGDVVTGGNQDRVIAHDELVLPGTVRNIEVFCVEKNRWTYYDSLASETDRQVGAFRGYYNVASPTVRQALHREGKQEAVWAAVAEVTAANNATSSTAAYAALDGANNPQKQRREACLSHFANPWTDHDQVVGVVAVSGGRVLGVDIFGHPDLFRRQFPALLHGYSADAVAQPVGPAECDPDKIHRAFATVAHLAAESRKSTENAGKFAPVGGWVHLYSK